MTDELLRSMAQACVTDIETCRSYYDQSAAVSRNYSVMAHAITELRTGIPQRFATYERFYNLNPDERERARRYHAEHLLTLEQVPTSPAALVAYLKTNVLTPVFEAA